MFVIFWHPKDEGSRSQWPRCLRRGSADAHLLGLWIRIPPRAWMSVSCVCCVLSGRGLCVGLITRPEESYRMWCVWVWSWILNNEEVLAHWGLLRHCKKKRLREPFSAKVWNVFINPKFYTVSKTQKTVTSFLSIDQNVLYLPHFKGFMT